MSRLQELYKSDVVAKLTEEFGYKNVMEVPRVTKITLNMGVGEALGDKKLLDNAVTDMEAMSGQKAVVTKARKSVASFKVRDGYPIGCKVTMRADRMWEFLDRFINVTSPNVRDFRGFSPKGFDGRGNFALGIPDQSIFPEIEIDKIKRQLGFDIIVVTSTNDNAQAKKLLDLFHFPFRENKKEAEAA